MLHNYECEKCGSICYIEGEMWESCPICEETPEEIKQRERAEHAEYIKLAAIEKCDSYANRYAHTARERDALRRALENLLDDVEKEGSHEIPSGTLNEARRALGGSYG